MSALAGSKFCRARPGAAKPGTSKFIQLQNSVPGIAQPGRAQLRLPRPPWLVQNFVMSALAGPKLKIEWH
jgi:hypothetical protein